MFHIFQVGVDHVIDLIEENTRREVVGHVFSSITVE
jgi:hypothetical protein